MDPSLGRVPRIRRAVALGRAGLRGLATALAAGVVAVLFVGLKRFLAGPAGLPTGLACLGATAAVVALLGAVTATRRKPPAAGDTVVRERAKGCLWGSFDLIPLPILVQTLHASWRTGVLAADFGGRLGRIYFERGDVVEASFGPVRGADAFNLMYAEKGGTFCFRPEQRTGVKRTVDSRVLRLLVNAERTCRDESSVRWAVRPMARPGPHRRTPEHDRERAR